MRRFVALPFVLALAAPWVFPGEAAARDLRFEERVEVQRAIERVYYSHLLQATVPFEKAVSRGTLEAKVRTYLAQSAALERFWHSPITREALRQETARIVRDTRFPDRLREIYAALGDDGFLFEECFARPILADRLELLRGRFQVLRAG